MRSKYADSPRKLPAQNGCDVYRISAGLTRHQRIPQTAENRTLRRARALSKREAFVASGRGRRQAAEAGADLRSKYADSPRKVSTRNRRDVDRIPAGAPRPNGSPTPRRIELCAGRGRKENATATQGGTRFPNGRPTETASQNIGSEWDAFSGWVAGGKFIPESSLRTGHAFPTAVQAESSSRNPASNWDALSAPSPQLQNPCALHSKTG